MGKMCLTRSCRGKCNDKGDVSHSVCAHAFRPFTDVLDDFHGTFAVVQTPVVRSVRGQSSRNRPWAERLAAVLPNYMLTKRPGNKYRSSDIAEVEPTCNSIELLDVRAHGLRLIHD